MLFLQQLCKFNLLQNCLAPTIVTFFFVVVLMGHYSYRLLRTHETTNDLLSIVWGVDMLWKEKTVLDLEGIFKWGLKTGSRVNAKHLIRIRIVELYKIKHQQPLHLGIFVFPPS